MAPRKAQSFPVGGAAGPVANAAAAPRHWLALRLGSMPTSQSADSATALTDPLVALAWRALQLTPWVAEVDGSLVLETSASERLFGGRRALLHKLLTPALGPLVCAQGPTARAALGRLALCKPETPGADGRPLASHAVPLDLLPLTALAAARRHLPTLERLGCRTWGELRALPRAGLARRFGAELVAALDQAYGLQPEVYPWLRLPEVFEAPLELAAQVESAPALLFGARRLLAQLLEWLRARQRGVLALELRWELDARRSNALHTDTHHDASGYGRLELRTAQATQDIRHLERLLAEQLARVVLPAPVLYLRLRTVSTQPLSGESHSLLVDEVRSGDSLHHMLERVAARLGPEQVRCVRTHAEHRPERMQHWQPTAGAAAADTGGDAVVREGALYPSWLLTTPQSLAVHEAQPQFHGPLTLLVGPQRLEAGWLDGEAPTLRDYFIARSQRHGLLWIYCERLSGARGRDAHSAPGQWYLHGLFA